MSEGSGEVNQNEDLRISGAIKEPLNQSETEKPEENQTQEQELVNPLTKTLMTEANNIMIPQNEENDENKNQSESKDPENDNSNDQPIGEENVNNEQENVDNNESHENNDEEHNENNENQNDQNNSIENQENQAEEEQNEDKKSDEDNQPDETQATEEEEKQTENNDHNEEETNAENDDTKDFEGDAENEPANNAEEADKNSDKETDHNENENENTNEEAQQEEGMSVIDNIRYGTPNAGKRIDVSTLPLLETPVEIETSCKRQIEYFKKRSKFADPSGIPQVLQYLQREKANQITKSQYKEAFNTDELIKKIVAYSQTLQKNEVKDARTGALETRISELDKELKNTQKEAEKQISEIKERHEKQVTRVQQLQKEEMQRLQDTWNDPAYLRRYEKPSAKLLQLSTVEHSLVSQGDFANADRIKNEIDELEIKESQQAQERATQEMLSQQQKMLKKHERENKLLDQQLESQIERVNIMTDTKTKTIEDRKSRVQKQLEVYKEDTKLPPLKPKEKTEAVITPRTQMRMIICKQSMRNPKISVKPLGALPTKKKRNSKLRESI